MHATGRAEARSVFAERAERFVSEKRCIAEYVAWWLRTRYVAAAVAVDGGTTNELIVTAVCRDATAAPPTVGTIISNSVAVLQTLIYLIPDGRQPQAIATGGELRGSRRTLLGPGAVKVLEEAWFAVAVVGANGFDPPVLTTNTAVEHPVKQAMVRRAANIVFPIDAFKWGLKAPSALVSLERLASADAKRIYLVTAYPMQDPAESDTEYFARVERFRECAAKQILTWIDTYGPGGIRAVCTRIMLPADPSTPRSEEYGSRVYDGNQLGSVDFFKEFVEKLPWDSTGKDVGLAIALELCDPKAVAS